MATSREVFSLRVKFLTVRGSLAEAEVLANQYLKDVAGRDSDLYRISGDGGHRTAEALLAHQKGHQPEWFIPCQEQISLGQRNWTKPTTIQVRYLTSNSLDALEKQTNDFCEKHEATKIKVKWLGGDSWTVVVNYAVAG